MNTNTCVIKTMLRPDRRAFALGRDGEKLERRGEEVAGDQRLAGSWPAGFMWAGKGLAPQRA